MTRAFAMRGRITRRTFAVGAACAAVPAACFAAERVHASDLWEGGGRLSARARELEGQIVSMRGYMAPPLRAEAKFFVLTRIPMVVCPFCDSEANWPEDLVVVEAHANEGPTIKRWRPRAQGRAFPIHKGMTHITIVVADQEA